MALDYLDFDFSGDAEGRGTFDAIAAAAPAQLAALQAEIVAVLAWAERQFGPAAPLEEGGDWDYELRGLREVSTPLAVRYVPGAPGLHMQAAEADPPRVTLLLTLTGNEAFCTSFCEEFDLV
jgi:hypothetical protein